MTVIYLKPTNFCNVDCDHCYLTEEVRANKLTIDRAGLVKVFEFIKGVRDKKNEREAHVIWHGGEPLMLTPEYYAEAMDIGFEILGDEGVSFSLQTSLMPFSRRWVDLCHKYFKSNIGSSVDFQARKIKGSNEQYLDLWMKRVKTAREEGLYVGPIMVPSRNELGHEAKIIDWIMDNGFKSVNFDRYTTWGKTTKDLNCPTNAEHSQFLINTFEHIIKRMDEGKPVPFINAIVAGINGVFWGQSGDRWGTSCMKDFVVVEPNGDLNSCPDRTSTETPFSNIDDGSDKFLRSKKRREWIRISDVTHKGSHCYQCKFSRFCKSGCPNVDNSTPEQCSGYYKFLEHVEGYKLDNNKYNKVINYLNEAV